MQRTALFHAISLLLLAACTQGSGGGSGGSGGIGATSTSTSSGEGGSECTSTHDCPCGPVLCQYTCDGCSQPCDPATPCPEGFWCDYPDDECGAGQPGVCKPFVAGGCGEDDRRTCSCSGVVPYLCPGVTAADRSADPALCSGGTFTCGNLECKQYLEYCETTLPGVQGAEPSYACKSSSACPITFCSCVSDLPPGACTIGADGQMRVTIALP